MNVRGPSEWSSPAAQILSGITDRWALAAGRYRLVERGTTDVDFVVEWNDVLVRTFEEAGYTVRQITDPLVGHPHLLICKRGEERIDLIIPTVAYQELALDRGAKNHVLTAEDVIIHKLLAWRPRDRDDVVSILEADHELDHDYIEHWAEEWELSERWLEARSAR